MQVTLPMDFENERLREIRATFRDLTQRVARSGPDVLGYVRWSAVISPWIWLAADTREDSFLVEEIAELASHIPPGTVGLTMDGAASVRLAWLQTRIFLRSQGVVDVSTLVRFLHEQRANIQAWMRLDSRFSEGAYSSDQVPRHGGAYLQDYMQEYILTLASAGNAELTALGLLLQALVHHPADRAIAPRGPTDPGNIEPRAFHGEAVPVPIPATQAPPDTPQESDESMATEDESHDESESQYESEDEEEHEHAPHAQPNAAQQGNRRGSVGRSGSVWDGINLEEEMRINVPTLEYIPKVIRGPYLQLYGQAITTLEEHYSRRQPDPQGLERKWKEFILLPRLLLHGAKHSGNARKAEFRRRIDKYRNGQIGQLLSQAHAIKPRRRATTHHQTTTAAQVDRQLWERVGKFIESGQISRAAKILHSSGMAPRNADTLRQLQDPDKRPPAQLEPLPPSVTGYVAANAVQLDGDRLIRNLRGARKGGAPGPSGTCNEHLKPLLEDSAATAALQGVANRFASADLPPTIARALCLCRMVALQKGAPGVSQAHGASSRVRGLAVGDTFRRLVGRTLAQQFHDEIEHATSPHQFGIASNSGVDAAVHLLRSITDLDPRATVTQIDGIGAFDHIRRAAMLGAVRDLPTGHCLIPYLLLAYGRQSVYLWEDEEGNVHEVQQGEGGEQGDALMPALFSLGLAGALREAQARLQEGELVIAYLDDLYIITAPERARDAYNLVAGIVAERCGIQPNMGKTVCWNRGNIEPPLMRDLGPHVWRGGGAPDRQGIRVLGAPLGTAAFARKFGEERARDTAAFSDTLLNAPQTQHAWLLLYYCLVPRANHLLRQTPPSMASVAAQAHDRVTGDTLARLLGYAGVHQMPTDAVAQARLPARLGGLGLRDSSRTSAAAFWASWADSMPRLHRLFPNYGNLLVQRLEADPGDGSSLGDANCLSELMHSRSVIIAEGRPLPSMAEILAGAQPVPHIAHEEPAEYDDEEQLDAGEFRHGWQRHTSQARETHAHGTLLSQSSRATRARVRSCAGQHSARWLMTAPTCDELRLRNPIMRVLLQRRLGLPIDVLREECEARGCRASLDSCGFHRSACTRTGRIHGRHAAALAPWRQVLSEAGYKVRTERMLRDSHLQVEQGDQRRMDLVAAPGARAPGAFRGLPLFCDVTVVSPHTQAGLARGSSANTNGAILRTAANRKRGTYSDISDSGVARLVVLGCEVYGRWCEDAILLVRQLAAAKAREAPPALRASARQAWSCRWWSLASVGVQRAIGEALLREGGVDLLSSPPPAGEPSLIDVVGDYV